MIIITVINHKNPRITYFQNMAISDFHRDIIKKVIRKKSDMKNIFFRVRCLFAYPSLCLSVEMVKNR